jgi:glutathione S-transferase
MSEPVPVLTYFQFRGLGEPIRLLFRDLGLPFEDRRIDLFSDEWKALSPTMLFGQLPRLQLGDLTLFQSHAILRHLARVNSVDGASEAERTRCDVGVEAARDLQQRLWDHFWSPGSDTPEAAKAFETGQLAGSLRLLANWLGGAPFFGGSRVLFADYFALAVLDEAAAFFPDAVEQAPVLAGYRKRMYERPGLAAYAASGEQPSGHGFDPARGIRSPAKASS